MPVRNGRRYIRQAIESLLSQTMGDFELIICDNASSDDTQDICRDYETRDSRVRYHRNERDIGPAANFNRCVELARGKYFRWHAHDDLCASRYLERCVETLEQDATVVLAYPRTTIVDETGAAIEQYEFHPRTNWPRASRRFAELVLVNHRLHRAVEIFGLMRLESLRQTPLQGAYARGDSVLLVRLALLGRFVELPQRLFLSRCHATQSMQTLPSKTHRSGRRWLDFLGTGPLPPPEWWDSSRKGKINFPEWNLLKEYWRSIGQSPIGLAQRWCCRLIMLQWLALNSHKLARDLIFAADTLLGRLIQGMDDEKHNLDPAGDKA